MARYRQCLGLAPESNLGLVGGRRPPCIESDAAAVTKGPLRKYAVAQRLLSNEAPRWREISVSPKSCVLQ